MAPVAVSRRALVRIGEPGGAGSRLKLGDQGEGWWRLRELKCGDQWLKLPISTQNLDIMARHKLRRIKVEVV